MPYSPPPGLEPSAVMVRVLNPADPSLPAFLEACRSKTGDVAVVSQLASGRDRNDGSLTWGLTDAFKAGRLDIARCLLELGVKWHAGTMYYVDSVEAVKLLIEFGFCVNDPWPFGNVILPTVVARNDEAFVRYLLSQGANPNLGPPLCPQERHSYEIRPMQNSGAALDAAAAYSTPEMFALLVAHGADISNASPLHSAARAGFDAPPGSRIPMMEYLVGIGLDVNAVDDAVRSGEGVWGTPLFCTIKPGRVQEAKGLLEKGADPERRVSWVDMTVREYATRSKANEKVDLMRPY
ncbi:ankyrin [Lophium mytilinum]|uniref:Ankyrin n=1 Tax=Lophium mytilinum TaxID=390894 RepID=A0A6A6RHD1_9PEZI|nr:ankyrin [Lophium mytilinum]